MTEQPVGGIDAPSLPWTKCKTLQRLWYEIWEMARHLDIARETLAKKRVS
jgi:hypothetical protein